MKKLFGTLVIGVFLVCAWALLPPFSYPRGETVQIPKGATVREASRTLKEKGAIRTALPFEIAVRLVSQNGVREGLYLLSESENVISLALRLSRGVHNVAAVKVTIPEGYTNKEIAAAVTEAIPDFNADRFLDLATKDEGYLFPDTYFFMPNASPETVQRTLRLAFTEKIAPYEAEIAASGRTLHEILTMASLIEEEARQPSTRKIVSGILWKRIDIGMALQVDAVFAYIMGIPGYAPKGGDLDIDSPYNTYTNRGLPPAPIANPGLDSIEAALRPTETEYLYYLTGKDGTMHYAETFEQHVANRKHLR